MNDVLVWFVLVAGVLFTLLFISLAKAAGWADERIDELFYEEQLKRNSGVKLPIEKIIEANKEAKKQDGKN